MTQDNIEANGMIAQAPSGKARTRVIVRAYGDEPVRLIAGQRQGTHLVVMNSVMDTEIGWPLAWVYRDDEKTYAALERAYRHGDRQSLAALWKQAERYAP